MILQNTVAAIRKYPKKCKGKPDINKISGFPLRIKTGEGTVCETGRVANLLAPSRNVQPAFETAVLSTVNYSL